MMNDNIDEERLREWQAWSARTRRFPIEQVQEVINFPETVLPSDEGYLITALLNSVDEVKAFVMKFDDISAFVDAGYVSLVCNEGDTGYEHTLSINDELCDSDWEPAPFEEEVPIFHVNEFFVGEEVHLNMHKVERYRTDQIVFNESITNLKFPVFARVCLLETFDRMGDVSMKQIEFHEMGDYENFPIRVW